MSSKLGLRMGTVGAIAALPLAFAGIASAATAAHPSHVRPMNGSECGYDSVGDDNVQTEMCTEVGGSGTYVNWVVAQIADGNSPNNQPTDVWFPTYAGCTVQATWMLWNNAGNSKYNNASPVMACSALKSAGGWQDAPGKQMEAGQLCTYVYLEQFGQEYGGNNCVGVH